MHPQAPFRRHGGDGRDVGDRVHGAALGGLGERDDGGLRHMVVAPPDGVQGRADAVRGQPAALAGDAVHEHAAAEHGRGVRLAGEDVRAVVAQHGTPWRAHGAERERVRGGPGDDGEDPGRRVLEDLAHLLLEPGGDVVPAVAERGAGVRGGDRREELRRDARSVVGPELDRRHRRTVPEPVGERGSGQRSAQGRGGVVAVGPRAVSRRSDSAIGTSLMLASRRRISPCASNSQFSLP